MEVVALQVDGGVAVVTLNRPRVLNASNLDMKRRLLGIFADELPSGRVRGVILTGAGRSFCTGGDLKESAGLTLEQYGESLRLQRALCAAIRNLDKPVVAAVNGYALGGGLEMAMMCDIRIAALSAQFGIPVVKAGSVATSGLYHLLVRTIGLARTAELALSGEPIAAREAERIGLVGKVVADEALLDEARERARRLADLPLTGVALAKRALRAAADVDFDTMAMLDERLALEARSARGD